MLKATQYATYKRCKSSKSLYKRHRKIQLCNSGPLKTPLGLGIIIFTHLAANCAFASFLNIAFEIVKIKSKLIVLKIITKL